MKRKKALAAFLMSLSILATPAITPITTFAQATPTTAPAAKKARVGVIHLSDTLLEKPASFSISLATLMSSGKPTALSSLIVTLNQAAKDTSLSGLYVDLSAFSLTLNQAQEVGKLLSDVRKAGKRVVIYSADFDTPTYVLASYADTVIMPDQGNVLIPGVGLSMMFFAGTLEKLNMSADFVQVGKFKGAEEPFTRKTASPEYRQQIEKLADGMYSQLVSTIAANRPNLDETQVKKLIDEAWLTGRRAKEAGLIDQTIARDKVDAWLESQFPAGITLVDDYGSPKKKSLDLESPFAILSLLGGSDKPAAKSGGPAIAVLYAEGEILPDMIGGEDTEGYVTPAQIRKAVKKALEDDNVKAIVLRVDSPGGSASASDEIWGILKDADKKKPVTVSMGRVAASGGYYISCSGRSIIADPATITGSIGVVGGKIVVKGLLDWAGINVEPVTRGQHAQLLSILKPFSDEERSFLKKSMEDVYAVFTSRVSAARGEKVAKLDEVTQGRLFTGEQAKAVGLVDDVGTLNDAIKAAAASAKLGEKYQILILPEAKTLSDYLREGLLSDVKTPPIAGLKFSVIDALLNSLPAEIKKPTQHALSILHSLEHERVLVTMPPGIVESHPHVGARPGN